MSTLPADIFDGLDQVANLTLERNQLRELPAGIFDGMDQLADLRIGRNQLTDLPDGIFAGLPALEILTADGNYLTRIKSSWFDGFEGGDSLTRFEFIGNDITSIDADALDGFTALERFHLSYNKLTSIPAGIFDGMANLSRVSLHFNELTTLPTGLFDRLTEDGEVGTNTTLQGVIFTNNQLTTLPAGFLDHTTNIEWFYAHRNRLTSLPAGLIDTQESLQELYLGWNQLTSLPSGFFPAGSTLEQVKLNDNRLTSLEGVGLENLQKTFWLELQNNNLTSLPSNFVASYVTGADSTPPTSDYCFVYFLLDNNPFSETWVAGGELSDFLSAYGSVDPGGTTESCPIYGTDYDLQDVEQLGLGGIDLGVTVTDQGKTAWNLLAEDFAHADSYNVLYIFSFGWDGLAVTEDVLAAIPTNIENLAIRDASFDSAVTGATFGRFQKSTAFTRDIQFRRPSDGVLTINYAFAHGYTATGGLQILELDGVGLTGDGSSILSSLPASTLQSLTVKNNAGLTSVPSGITGLTNLKGLDFQNTGIASLDADAFNGLSDLYFLSFEGSEISSVDEDAFDGLSAVQILFLNDNEIDSLDSDVLADMTSLRQLLLNDNELLTLPGDLFEGLENLDTVQLGDNPGSPFGIGVSVVDDTADDTMSQLDIREGAPYSFVAKIVEDGAVSSVVPVSAGATSTTDAFTHPDDAEVELPDQLREWHGSDFEFCLGFDECFDGFEFVLNPKPSIVAMRFVTHEGQLYSAGDELRFEVQFDTEVVVEGTPQLSFELGDEMRFADYVEGNPHSTLYFEYTLQEIDPTPDRISMANSMLAYPTGSSIKDTDTGTVADATPRQTQATSEALTTTSTININTARARISRIEPTIRSVTVSGGDEVRLSVDVYGAQDLKDNSLGNVGFIWEDGGAGGSFLGNGREVTYTAPNQSGAYTISVATPFSACRVPATAETRCATTFEIRVRRASAPVEPKPEPRNPAGTIPSILADPGGNQYEVFTPEDGGTFTGDRSSLSAGPGTVPNGEIVGLRISEGGAASNAGKTYQRYTVGGSWHQVSAVDASGNVVASYELSDAAVVCIPLPDELRSNISDVALVAINPDNSLTILASNVRITTSGLDVCGNLSSVPVTVAVGSSGSPAPLPTEVPEMDDASGLPDTGGVAPSSNIVVLTWLLMTGMAIVVAGWRIGRVARRKAIHTR